MHRRSQPCSSWKFCGNLAQHNHGHHSICRCGYGDGKRQLLGGHRVTEVLAENVTKTNHHEGLCANLTTSSLVLLSEILGLPVSTIIGIGLLRGNTSLHWATMRDPVLAWIVTVPVSAILAYLASFLFPRTL